MDAGWHQDIHFCLCPISPGTNTQMTTWQRWPATSPWGKGSSRHYSGAVPLGPAWGGWCPIWLVPTESSCPPPAWTDQQEPSSREGPQRCSKCCLSGWRQLETQNRKQWSSGGLRWAGRQGRTNFLGSNPSPALLHTASMCIVFV